MDCSLLLYICITELSHERRSKGISVGPPHPAGPEDRQFYRIHPPQGDRCPSRTEGRRPAFCGRAARRWLHAHPARSRFRADHGDRRRDHGEVSGYACHARQMTEPNEPLWISYEQAIAIHSRQLRRFGGAPGLRDEGMLRSALERPINKWQYEQSELEQPGLAALAAAYAFGLAKNHAFVDG